MSCQCMYTIRTILIIIVLCSCKNGHKAFNGELSHPVESLVPYSDIAIKIEDKQDEWDLIEEFHGLSKAPVAIIGKETSQAKDFIGTITDVEVTESGIWLLDNSQMKIRNYSHDGFLLYEEDLGYGRGPADYNMPTDIDIYGGYLYVADFYSISKYQILDDSISYIDKITYDHTVESFCIMDDFIFFRTYIQKKDKANLVAKYKLDSKELIAAFGEPYKTSNPRLSASGKISCNSKEKAITYTYEHFQYIYNYSIDGEIRWLSKIEDFTGTSVKETIVGGVSASYRYGYGNEESAHVITKIMDFEEFTYIEVTEFRKNKDNQVKGYIIEPVRGSLIASKIQNQNIIGTNNSFIFTKSAVSGVQLSIYEKF